MAYYTQNDFRSYQGNARPMGFVPLSQRLRLPVATLVLGAVAALAIAVGLFDRQQTQSVTGDLSQIEYLTGDLPGTF